MDTRMMHHGPDQSFPKEDWTMKRGHIVATGERNLQRSKFLNNLNELGRQKTKKPKSSTSLLQRFCTDFELVLEQARPENVEMPRLKNQKTPPPYKRCTGKDRKIKAEVIRHYRRREKAVIL